MMTEETALFVKPLLEMVFDKVSCSEMLPEDYFDLDEFRQLPLNLFAGDIRSWYYNLCREHLKYDFEKPLFVPEKSVILQIKQSLFAQNAIKMLPRIIVCCLHSATN